MSGEQAAGPRGQEAAAWARARPRQPPAPATSVTSGHRRPHPPAAGAALPEAGNARRDMNPGRAKARTTRPQSGKIARRRKIP